MERNFVVFTTEVFRDEQPDEELDQWFLGEDCARWLHQKLLAVPGVAHGAAPLEEDWHGWSFGLRAHEVWFWINVWCSFNERKTWIVGIEPRPGLLGAFRKERTRQAKAMLSDAIDSVLASAHEVTSHHWHDKNPLE
jgi:hypothetical protein